jgi:hypothetical protein
MLDDALGQAGAELEVEDIVGEAIVLPAVNVVIGRELKLSTADRNSGSLSSQIKAAAKRQNIQLLDGWKASAAIHLVSTWAEQKTNLPEDVLDRAATLFAEVQERFSQMDKQGNSTTTHTRS